MIHKLCRLYRDSHEDREDLFQEIVFQLWKSYPKFRGDAKISTWMYRVALNVAIYHTKVSKKRISTIPIDGQTIPYQENNDS